MKQINEKFEDAEYKIIKSAKKKSGLTWRRYIIESALQFEADEVKNG